MNVIEKSLLHEVTRSVVLKLYNATSFLYFLLDDTTLLIIMKYRHDSLGFVYGLLYRSPDLVLLQTKRNILESLTRIIFESFKI